MHIYTPTADRDALALTLSCARTLLFSTALSPPPSLSLSLPSQLMLLSPPPPPWRGGVMHETRPSPAVNTICTPPLWLQCIIKASYSWHYFRISSITNPPIKCRLSKKKKKKPTILILWQECGKQVQGLRHQLIDKDRASLSVYPSSQIKGNTRRTSMLRVCVYLCVTACARKAVDQKRKTPVAYCKNAGKSPKGNWSILVTASPHLASHLLRV